MFSFTANFAGIQAWGVGAQSLPDGVHKCRITAIATEPMKGKNAPPGGTNAIFTLVSEAEQTRGVSIRVWMPLPGGQNPPDKNRQYLSRWRQLLEALGVDLNANPNVSIDGGQLMNVEVHVFATEPEPGTNGRTSYDFVSAETAQKFADGSWVPVYKRDRGTGPEGTNVSTPGSGGASAASAAPTWEAQARAIGQQAAPVQGASTPGAGMQGGPSAAPFGAQAAQLPNGTPGPTAAPVGVGLQALVNR